MPSKIPSGISGADTVKALETFGFNFVRQKGSHKALKRLRPHGGHDTIIVPQYKEMDRGLLRRIMNQAGVTVDEFLAALS